MNKLKCSYCHTEINDRVLAIDKEAITYHVECARCSYITCLNKEFAPFLIVDLFGHLQREHTLKAIKDKVVIE